MPLPLGQQSLGPTDEDLLVVALTGTDKIASMPWFCDPRPGPNMDRLGTPTSPRTCECLGGISRQAGMVVVGTDGGAYLTTDEGASP